MTDDAAIHYFETHLVSGGPSHLGSDALDLRTYCGAILTRNTATSDEIERVNCPHCRRTAAFRYAQEAAHA